MKIGIIGTRGIPNNYGGFEQFAENLSWRLVKKGFDITVYNPSFHPYKESEWKGVRIIHQWDPCKYLGTIGQFIYDLKCIQHARTQGFDVILQLGYTSSSIWGSLLPKSAIITTNMDGLEWKRTKFNSYVQKFLLFAEKLAVKHSDYLIADSVGIQNYILRKFGKSSAYIPYGADLFEDPNFHVLENFNIEPYKYNMLVARLEPENSIEIILDAHAKKSKVLFLVVGNYNTNYGRFLRSKYSLNKNIVFLGAIYNQEILNNLRFFSNIYFHGHTVGGTNPSLLEAMASSSLICAHANVFNRAILKRNAFYFHDTSEICSLLELDIKKNPNNDFVNNNLKLIKSKFSWNSIVNQYLKHFVSICPESCSDIKVLENSSEFSNVWEYATI